MLTTPKSTQHFTEKRSKSWQTSFRWFSIIWFKSKTKFQSNGCLPQKVTTKIWKTIKTLKRPDSAWELSIGLFTLLDNNKSWQSYQRLFKLYWDTPIGDTSIQLLWPYLKSVSTSINHKKFHPFYKWSSGSWKTQTQCWDIHHATL